MVPLKIDIFILAVTFVSDTMLKIQSTFENSPNFSTVYITHPYCCRVSVI